MSAPNPSDNLIDSRTIVARIEALGALRAEVGEEAWLDHENAGELLTLELLQLEVEAVLPPWREDWPLGVTMVRDSHLKDYLQQTLGYQRITFNGVVYWIR